MPGRRTSSDYSTSYSGPRRGRYVPRRYDDDEGNISNSNRGYYPRNYPSSSYGPRHSLSGGAGGPGLTKGISKSMTDYPGQLAKSRKDAPSNREFPFEPEYNYTGNTQFYRGDRNNGGNAPLPHMSGGRKGSKSYTDYPAQSFDRSDEMDDMFDLYDDEEGPEPEPRQYVGNTRFYIVGSEDDPNVRAGRRG